jgi:hypothetical protein
MTIQPEIIALPSCGLGINRFYYFFPEPSKEFGGCFLEAYQFLNLDPKRIFDARRDSSNATSRFMMDPRGSRPIPVTYT